MSKILSSFVLFVVFVFGFGGVKPAQAGLNVPFDGSFTVNHEDDPGVTIDQIAGLWARNGVKYRANIGNGADFERTVRADFVHTRAVWVRVRNSRGRLVRVRQIVQFVEVGELVTLSPGQIFHYEMKRGPGRKLRSGTVNVYETTTGGDILRFSSRVRPVRSGWLEDDVNLNGPIAPPPPPPVTYTDPGFIVVNEGSVPFQWASISSATYQGGVEKPYNFNTLIQPSQAGQVLPPANGDWQIQIVRTDGKVAVPQDATTGQSRKFRFDTTWNQWVIRLSDSDFRIP